MLDLALPPDIAEEVAVGGGDAILDLMSHVQRGRSEYARKITVTI